MKILFGHKERAFISDEIKVQVKFGDRHKLYTCAVCKEIIQALGDDCSHEQNSQIYQKQRLCRDALVYILKSPNFE